MGCSGNVRIYTFVLALISTFGIQAQTPESHWWVPQGEVHAIAIDSATNSVYLGGNFSGVVPPVPMEFGVEVDTTAGMPLSLLGRPNGRVEAVAPDGEGGWYLSGDGFTSIDGLARDHIAHLAPDGSVTDWQPEMGWSDFSKGCEMAKVGNKVYIGGPFVSINGTPRDAIAVVDAATGTITHDWLLVDTMGFPMVNAFNGRVYEANMVIHGQVLYVSLTYSIPGAYTSVIAAVNTTTNETIWSAYVYAPPGHSATVTAIEYNAGLLYVGGDFSGIGTETRNCLMALDASSGEVLPWDPGANFVDAVRDLAVSDDKVFIIGWLTGSVDEGQTILQGCLAIDRTSGALLPWQPQLTTTTGGGELEVIGQKLFISGAQNQVEGATRNGLAAVDVETGALLDWNPMVNTENGTFCMAKQEGKLFIGGFMTQFGYSQPRNLVALDGSTGRPIAWHPGTNGLVRALAINSSTVFIGGEFSQVHQVSRAGLAALDRITVEVLPFACDLNGPCYALGLQAGSLYAGGSFTLASGSARSNLAAMDATTGALQGWAPQAYGPVYALNVAPDQIRVGGAFSSMNGDTERGNLCGLDPATGDLTSWAPVVSGPVNTLLTRPNVVHFGGQFLYVNGQPRNNVAAVSSGTGMLDGWNPSADGPVNEMAYRDGLIYLAGGFLRIHGQERLGIAAVDVTTAEPTTWNPTATTVYAMAVWNKIFLGSVYGWSGVAPLRVYPLSSTTLAPSLRIRAILEGPYVPTTGLMKDQLRTAELLPISEPYTALGYGHEGSGFEQVQSNTFHASGSDGIVDWVMVELRDPLDPTLVLKTSTALLQRDGDVVDIDGVSPLVNWPQADSYLIALRHRNHLGIMTAQSYLLGTGGTNIDFTNSVSVFGTGARKSVAGTFPAEVLWAGDVNFDGAIKYTGELNDRDPILTAIGGVVPTNSVFAYSSEDVNLDGIVKYTGGLNDRDLILENIGGVVPTNSRVEQMP